MRKDCKDIRKEILRISHLSGHGHIPSCFSIVEILCAVYETKADDDIFILSKGHAALAHYCVLDHYKHLSWISGLDYLGGYNSRFGCHADRLKVPAVNVSTGSLGHGIGIAVGMALGFKIQGKPNRVIVLIGDGEANEGSVWEAVMVTRRQGLDNLTIIYDNNYSHQRGLQLYFPERIFDAFRLAYITRINGHDVDKIKEALEDESRVIIADTIKGYGCYRLVNAPEWHRRSPSQHEYEQMIKELDEDTV